MEYEDIELPVSGSFHVVCPDTNPGDVYNFMRSTTKELEQDLDFYEHLLEKTNIEMDGDATLVTFNWDEQDILTQYFAFRMQEQFAPEIEVTSITHTENPDGSFSTHTGVLSSDDSFLDSTKCY